MSPPRCRWCGRYGARPVTRTVQAGDGHWSTKRQALCPEHEQNWTTDSPWNQPADPATEVIEL